MTTADKPKHIVFAIKYADSGLFYRSAHVPAFIAFGRIFETEEDARRELEFHECWMRAKGAHVVRLELKEDDHDH